MSELDDAVARFDRRESARLDQAQRADAEADARRSRLVSLVDDFLTRMNSLGNPGTMTYPGSSVRAWSLVYDPDAEKPKSIWLTVDGRTPYSELVAKKKRFGGVSYEYDNGLRSVGDPKVRLSDATISRLAVGMAAALRRYQPEPSDG